MTDAIKQSILDVLASMNTAVKNVRFYPQNSAIVINAIEKLHQTFLNVFTLDQSLRIAEAEKTLLIDGEPLSRKYHEKPYIMSILDLLLTFGIRSITFNKGLEKRELITLLECLAKNPIDLESQGGLLQIIAKKNLLHILLHEKVFVVRDQSRQILSGLDITDDESIRFLSLSHPELLKDQQKLLELAGNPEWLLKSFEVGITQLTSEKGTLSNVQIAEKLTNMIELMGKVSDQLGKTEQANLVRGIEKSTSMIAPGVAEEIITLNREHVLGGVLMQHLVRELKRVTPAVVDSGDGQVIDLTKGKEAFDGELFLHLQEIIERLFTDSEKGVLDESIMAALLNTMEKLVTQKGLEAVEIMIDRLLRNMLVADAKVREQAARALVEIIESFSEKQKNDCVKNISAKLLDWIRIETLAIPAYKKICDFLKDLVNDLIRQESFYATIPILDIFNDIRTGILEKNDTIQGESVAFINACASEEHLEILFNNFQTGEQSKKIEAGEMLIRLGDDALNRLLDILHDETDSNQRVRIMRLIISGGRRIMPRVRDRIDKDQSWYYLRNIAYILGHIGDEGSAKALQPLLLHEKNKVRMEALKSISRTGGKERGPLLLSILPKADHKFMINIIDALGSAKCAEAVTVLVELFENSPVKNKEVRTNMEEKICNALGMIGSPEAIPALSKIVESKSFLGISRYTETVKASASRALASIKNR